jgi:tRNA threonylcarbamoyladenosine biosynthesis protein TsaB
MRVACLGIDSATRPGSVGLDVGSEVTLEALSAGGRHARDLLTAIEALLGRSAIGPDCLRGIGVAVGPGSFTGVRVGMATAKGLGFALDVPVEGLSTLEALARATADAASGAGHLCPALDAGRGEVYTALFRVRGAVVERLEADRAWKPGDRVAAIPADTVLVGDGAAALLSAAMRPHRAIETPLLGGALARWAGEVIPDGGRYRAGGLGPNYVRPSDVEASRRRV